MLKHERPRGADEGLAPDAGTAVQRKASGGAPLPAGPRARMESSLGADLGGVRVHDDAASHASAAGLHADAYTTGGDIHFAEGKYAPDDPFGLHLLAHEVAHTVQQGGGHQGVQARLAVGSSTDSAEGEADRFADHIVHGAPQPALSPAGPSIQRQEATDTPVATATPTPTATPDPNAQFYAEVSAVVAAMLAQYQALPVTVPIGAPPAAATAEATAEPTATAEATASATATAAATETPTPTATPQPTTTAYVDVPYWNNNYPKHGTDQATGDVPPDVYWNANDGTDRADSAENDGNFRNSEIREYDAAVPDGHATRDDHFGTVVNDNAMVAKGSPSDIRLLLETAIAHRVITAPDVPGTDAQAWATAWKTTLEDWMAKAGVGVDCSGLVYSTLRAIRDRVGGARTSGEAGANGILDYATASGADVPDFGNLGEPVTNWFTLQPGDTMTIPGHVRIVMTIEERTDSRIRFTTSESTPNPSGGPGPDTYEGPRWHEWLYEQTADGVVRQQRYTPGGPWSDWTEDPSSIVFSRHIAPPA